MPSRLGFKEYMMTRGFSIGPVGTFKPMASLGGDQHFKPHRKYATTMPAMSASYKGAGHGTMKPMLSADAKRIPRKPGQKAKSDKHSDLYTDEDPKGTIHGLGFTDKAKAKQSVSKIRGSDRTHAHKMRLLLQCHRGQKLQVREQKILKRKRIWDRLTKSIKVI